MLIRLVPVAPGAETEVPHGWELHSVIACDGSGGPLFWAVLTARR